MNSTAAQSLRRPILLALGAAILFAGALGLYTRQNTFPFFYHPDEPDKVDQLITGKWNFHHPLLMLGTAETAKKALGIPDNEQSLVILGRWCSAAFAAGGVLWLALLGLRVRGPAGFWIIGLLLLTQHQVFELAHYFKEDTALFFAVALAFLALHIYHRRPATFTSLFVGATCGLCLSAKYLGAVMIVPAAVILIAAQRGHRARATQWLWFACGFVAIAAAINFPIFRRLDVFTHSFGRETVLVAHGERGYTGGQVAILEYLHMLVINTTPVVWFLIIAELIAVRKRADVFAWTMAISPFAFLLLLSCSTKTNDRYFLPVTGGLYYLAGLGVLDLPALLPLQWTARLKPALVTALALLVNIFNYPAGLASYIAAFSHDDRGEMLAWIRTNIPATAVIAAENRADLPTPDREERLAVQPLLPQRIIETKYAADLAPIPSALPPKGINYIVLSESDYGIFLRKAASSHLSTDLQRKRAFYDALFKNYQPVWQRPRSTGVYLHPGLSIYRLTP